jgi:hypothetical protein
MKNKENKKYSPLEAMSHAGSPTSPEALNRLKEEKGKQNEYYYIDIGNGALSIIPPTVERVDLGPRQKMNT